MRAVPYSGVAALHLVQTTWLGTRNMERYCVRSIPLWKLARTVCSLGKF